MKEEFKNIVNFRPAFDKRNADPSKDYGIGSMRCTMVLIGKKGAVSFVFSTGILLERTIEEYIKEGRAKYELTDYGHFFLNKPMAFQVGYCSPKPLYEGQQITTAMCPWIGCSCYSDSSSLLSDEYLKTLIKEGSDKTWEMLEKFYQDNFKN